MNQPTYSAIEIKAMCLSFDLDHDTFKVMVDLIEQEIDLYSEEDLIVLVQSSMILFTRAMLKLSLKNM